MSEKWQAKWNAGKAHAERKRSVLQVGAKVWYYHIPIIGIQFARSVPVVVRKHYPKWIREDRYKIQFSNGYEGVVKRSELSLEPL